MSFSPSVSQNIQENHYKFQLECYLKDPLLPRSEDPLLWWKRNKAIYSNLVSVAVKYLSAPPSSIYSETIQYCRDHFRRKTQLSSPRKWGAINIHSKEPLII